MTADLIKTTLARTIGLSLVLAGAAVPGFALAESKGVEPASLNWVRAGGAEVCPAGPEVSRAVEHRLGRSALVPPASAKLVVEAYVEGRNSGGFRVAIRLLRDGEMIGQREIESPDTDCRDIADKAALAIALMIDPEAPLTAPPAREPTREASPPAKPPPPVVTPAPVPREEAPEPWQGDLELAFGIYAGLLPDLAPGVFARGRALPPGLPFAAELEGGYLPEQSVEALAGKGGHFTLFFAGASLCTRPPRDTRLAASGCGGMRLGSMVGRGYGFDINPKFQSWVPTVAARGRLWFRPLRGLAVLVGPDILVPLKRDQFITRVSGQATPLFRMSPVAVGFELGAVWEL